jgi:dTMP kinase
VKAQPFFTFEGGEGAGKTTLIRSLARHFEEQGKTTLVLREPGGTPLGDALRELLLSQTDPVAPYAELCLFLASRAQQIQTHIRPALTAGHIVLCDRYNDSSIVYQGMARGLGMDEVAYMAHYICQGIEPTLTLYLDIPPKEGLARAEERHQKDCIEKEPLPFHEKVRQAYLDLHKQHPQRIRLIDATQPRSSVFEHALREIQYYV